MVIIKFTKKRNTGTFRTQRITHVDDFGLEWPLPIYKRFIDTATNTASGTLFYARSSFVRIYLRTFFIFREYSTVVGRYTMMAV